MSNRDLVIQLRLPRPGRRGWAAAALAVSLVGAAAVYADVQWTPFAQGEKLSSAKMNMNLKAMADAIAALQGQGGPGVSYCGTSAKVQNGMLGGYVAANKLCQPACQNAQSAHVCRNDEIGRIASGGTMLADGAYATFATDFYQSGGTADCYGFGSSDLHAAVAAWQANLQSPTIVVCNTAFVLHCCK